jgi:hypothetical protein
MSLKQNGTVSYAYDAAGNRTQMTSTLNAVPAGSFSYDANDRLTDRLPVGTMAKLMEVSTKIERAARGEVDETQALPINVIIGRRPPQNEEEAALDRTIPEYINE